MNADLATFNSNELALPLPGEAIDEQRRLFLRVKPVCDAVLAVALLALFGPLVLLLGLLVRATSRGPAFYTQARVGLRGAVFTMIKLRTMEHDCERLSGPRWSSVGDPRVTRLGHWLRLWHLDELPQLINVIRGEMSLVGPRPERPEIVKELERVIPGYRARLQVRPGVTGLAQIQLEPDVHISDVRRKLFYDVYYMARMGASFDVRILIGTGMKLFGCPFEVIRRALSLPVPDVALASGGPGDDLEDVLPPAPRPMQPVV